MATRKHRQKKLSNTTMLFIVIAIALAVIVVSGGIPEVAQFARPVTKCTDTDKGFNTAVQGTCAGKDGRFTDYCTSSSEVMEYVCTGLQCTMDAEAMPCIAGCKNGACLPAIQIMSGDAFFCENSNDPNWVWYLSQLQTADQFFLANFDQTLNDPGEAIGVGNCLFLPNNYARICFDSFDNSTNNATVSIRDSGNNIIKSGLVPLTGPVSYLGFTTQLGSNTNLQLSKNSPSIERLSDGQVYMTVGLGAVSAKYNFGGSLINPPRPIIFLGYPFTITSVADASFTIDALPSC